MKIRDLLRPEAIELSVSAGSKEEIIDSLISLHEKAGNLKNVTAYKEAILAREAEGSTAIGEGIAVPHAKSDSVKQAGLAAATVPSGIDYGAPDGQPSNLFFMIAAPQDGGDVHLEILSRLMVMLMDPDFCNKLRNASDPEEFLEIIDRQEAEKYPEEQPEEKAEEVQEKKDGYRILAVTACPTGIAHTYMAAEALQQTAEKMGYTIKIETDGASGAKNIPTKEEIAACDGIIVAADKNVEMARFDGKRVLKTSVSAGINRPEELIQKIIDGKAPVYHAQGGSQEEAGAEEEKEGIGHRLYKHLMNGVSHMLPFVVGGGVLIALGFLIDTVAGNANVGSNFGQTSPVAAVIYWIGQAAFSFMLPILAGFISQSIADRPGLLPGIVGGYLATTGATLANPTGDATAVSGFLGALLAGFVAGVFVNWLKKGFQWMPKSMDAIKPVFI